ncbi:hypothetical protein N7507_003224 [Penicillium longicatenatum]|nr:hypothetical protein N7507_003224 [Penicillium longicatenatum]
MDTIAVGNLSGIAPFIGSALGTVMAGWLCDFSATYLAKRNHGTYEPESRLLIIFPAAIAMAIGSFGLGAAIHNSMSAIVCGVFMAIISFAVGLGCTGIVSYTNDACGEKASDAFGIAMVIKSAFTFGLSFLFNDFYIRSGALAFFSTFGAVTVGVMLTTIPLYIFGKRIRAWADSHDLLRHGSREIYSQ